MPVKLKTKIVRDGRVWKWSVFDARALVGGGTCRTKADANNDAGIFVETREQRDADAALIAAAPDMLEALKKMHQKYGKLHDALSDCIESGRLSEKELPDDYMALATYLAEAIDANAVAEAAIAKAGGAK